MKSSKVLYPSAPIDPNELLLLAENFFEEGDFQSSLDHYIWFHRNALSYNKNLHGVRLSFALSGWYRLAKVYPEAMELLKAERDKAQISGSQGDWSAFADAAAINSILGEDDKNAVLFEKLIASEPSQAVNFYSLVSTSLIRCKRFDLCIPYVSPLSDYKQIEGRHLKVIKILETGRAADDKLSLAQAKTIFENDVKNLLSILRHSEEMKHFIPIILTDARKISPEMDFLID